MDKFLTGLSLKRKAWMKHHQMCFQSKRQRLQNMTRHLVFGLTCTTVGNEERPQCVVCLKVLACDSLRPNKLRRHLETKHPKHKDKPVEFSRQKRVNCRAQQSLFTKAASVPANAQLTSYKVAYRVAQCKKPHTIAEPQQKNCLKSLTLT